MNWDSPKGLLIFTVLMILVSIVSVSYASRTRVDLIGARVDSMDVEVVSEGSTIP